MKYVHTAVPSRDFLYWHTLPYFFPLYGTGSYCNTVQSRSFSWPMYQSSHILGVTHALVGLAKGIPHLFILRLQRKSGVERCRSFCLFILNEQALRGMTSYTPRASLPLCKTVCLFKAIISVPPRTPPAPVCLSLPDLVRSCRRHG